MEQVGRAQHGVDVMRASGRADYETIREKSQGKSENSHLAQDGGPVTSPERILWGLATSGWMFPLLVDTKNIFQSRC